MARFEEPRGEPRPTGGSTASSLTLAHSPFVALHGFAGRGSDWAILRDRLKGHAWLAPDFPGHGPEPSGEADLEAHLATIDRALGFFSEPPVLLGYSMGGRVALHAALATPERFSALVLIGASPGLQTETERVARRESDAALAGRILNSDIREFLTGWDASPLLAGRAAMPEPWKTRSFEARAKNTPAGLAASLAGVGTGALPSLWEKLGGIEIPVLLITGANDEKFTDIARRMAEKIPGATHAIVPDAGHAAHQEQSEGVAAVVAGWLAKTPAKAE